MPFCTIGWLSQQREEFGKLAITLLGQWCYVLVQEMSFVPEEAELALVSFPNGLSWPLSEMRHKEDYHLYPASDI